MFCSRCKKETDFITCCGCSLSHCINCIHWHSIICSNPIFQRPEKIGEKERSKIFQKLPKFGVTKEAQDVVLNDEPPNALAVQVEPIDLHKLIWSKPMHEAAKEIGVSILTLRRRCKKLNINTPPVGYWNKKKDNGSVISNEIVDW
jgi:hypothetical protein